MTQSWYSTQNVRLDLLFAAKYLSALGRWLKELCERQQVAVPGPAQSSPAQLPQPAAAVTHPSLCDTNTNAIGLKFSAGVHIIIVLSIL